MNYDVIRSYIKFYIEQYCILLDRHNSEKDLMIIRSCTFSVESSSLIKCGQQVLVILYFEYPCIVGIIVNDDQQDATT